MPCPEKFQEALAEYSIDPEVVREIAEGYEGINSKSPKKKKAAYFCRALNILESKAEREKVNAIFEYGACCKSGTRLKNSKEFARINAALPIEERLAKLCRAPYMYMGAPRLTEEGMLKIDAVNYVDEGRYACACSNFRKLKRDYSVSRTYCRCCGGHFKFHYEIMLGVKLELVEVVSSPLDTEGREPCAFLFKIAD